MAKGINIIKYILLVCVFSLHFGVYDSIAQQTSRRDYIADLYNALEAEGYTYNEIGDKEHFRSKMSNKDTRKAFYDYVVGRNDFNIGSYEAYEADLASSYDVVEVDKASPAQVQQTPRHDYVSDLYDALIESGKYDASELAGNKDNFRNAMSSKETRKAMYDWIAGNEDFDIGPYDTYEVDLASSYDDVSKLYNALIDSGNYNASQLAGGEEGFREFMSSKDNRQAMYQWIKGNNNFGIGPYDKYEARLSSSYDTEVPIRETPNQEKCKTTEEAMGAESKAYLYTFLKYFAALCFICLFIWGMRNLHKRFFPSRTKEAITAKKRSNNKGESTLAPIGAETSRSFTTLRSKTTAICNMKKIITILLAVYLCVLGFLFAINGRYTALGDVNGYHLVFDKWSKKVLLGDFTWYETKDYEKK